MGKRDVSNGVKKYIRYVCLRNELAKRNLIDISDNQQSYFSELKKGIFLWGKDNRISFNYELGKISFDKVKQLLGYDKRRTFRFLHNAREKLVKRIYELENELFIQSVYRRKTNLLSNRRIEMRNLTKRQATYTINVPIQITFASDNDLTAEELFEQSKSEVLRRLANGYFDVLLEKVDLVKKVKHRTREEIAEENKTWSDFFSSLRGLK